MTDGPDGAVGVSNEKKNGRSHRVRDFLVSAGLGLIIALPGSVLVRLGIAGATGIAQGVSQRTPECVMLEGGVVQLSDSLSNGAARFYIGMVSTAGYAINNWRTTGDFNDSFGLAYQGMKFTGQEAGTIYIKAACQEQSEQD